MAEVMTVTWKPPCLVFEPNPLQGASENWGLRQTLPEHGEAGEGPVIECPQAADPGQSPPVLVSRGMTKMKPVPLTEHAGLCPAWPSRISPTPTLNTCRVPNLPWSQVWWLWVCGSLDLEYSSQLQRFQLLLHVPCEAAPDRLPDPFPYSPGVHHAMCTSPWQQQSRCLSAALQLTVHVPVRLGAPWADPQVWCLATSCFGKWMRNAATGCRCRIKDKGLGGSNVNSLGVSTIRPGPSSLRAAPSPWGGWQLSVRSWRRSRSNRKSASRKFKVGCFKIGCWVHNRPPIPQDSVRPSLKAVYCRKLALSVLSGKEGGGGERRKQRQRQGKTQRQRRGRDAQRTFCKSLPNTHSFPSISVLFFFNQHFFFLL